MTSNKPISAVTCQHCCFKDLCELLEVPTSMRAEAALDRVRQQDISLTKHQALYQKGDDFTSLYVVKHGAIKTVNQADKIISFHFQGDFLGIDGFEDYKHHLQATALEDSLICAFDFNHFLDNTRSRTQTNRLLANLFAKQLNQHAESQMYPKEAIQKICQLLLRLSEHNKQFHYAPDVINLPMQRKDMANYLEMTLETLSRSLLTLRQEGVLVIHNKRILIQNLTHLYELADSSLT